MGEIRNLNTKVNRIPIRCRNRCGLEISMIFEEEDQSVDLYIEDDVISISSNEFQGSEHLCYGSIS